MSLHPSNGDYWYSSLLCICENHQEGLSSESSSQPKSELCSLVHHLPEISLSLSQPPLHNKHKFKIRFLTQEKTYEKAKWWDWLTWSLQSWEKGFFPKCQCNKCCCKAWEKKQRSQARRHPSSLFLYHFKFENEMQQTSIKCSKFVTLLVCLCVK